MAYSVEDIDKILGFTSWSDKRKIEKLLEIDADLYCNLGKLRNFFQFCFYFRIIMF